MAYVPGSLTLAQIAAWADESLSVPAEGPELVALQTLFNAVEAYVLRSYYNDTADEPGIRQAITQQVARTWQRRTSPDGIAAAGDNSVITFGGLDRDLQWLLREKWGFA